MGIGARLVVPLAVLAVLAGCTGPEAGQADWTNDPLPDIAAISA